MLIPAPSLSYSGCGDYPRFMRRPTKTELELTMLAFLVAVPLAYALVRALFALLV